MSNSSLVNYTKLSPYKNTPRRDPITKITIHHMAGNLSVEACGEVFQSSEASSNYGIGSDGRVGMYVEEKDRAWTSSSSSNDHQAVTIEVANDGGAPDWHVSNTALAKLIDLCVDICKRNGIKSLNYTGDTSGNLTRHNMFTATACPGSYLQGKFPYIAEQVNKKLAAETAPKTTKLAYNDINVGDIVNFAGGMHYTSATGKSGSPIAASRAKVTQKYKADSPHPIHLRAVNSAGKEIYGVYGWCDLSSISKIETINGFTPFLVRVTAKSLNIRSGAGTRYDIVGDVKRDDVYTIVAVQDAWGKLKSGAGWISLAYTERV